MPRFPVLSILAIGFALFASHSAVAEETKTAQPPAHVALLKDAKKVDGLLPLYHKENKLYVELTTSHYGNEYIVLISISRGIGQGMVLGGMSWGFGDDWVWKFRKVGNKVHIIRRNVRFKANKGNPEAAAVRNAYTDSVLFSLPIAAKGPKGGDLVDLSPVFMSDLPQISQSSLRGFSFSASKSTWAEVKGFPKNVELEVAATYASSGSANLETVADSRGVTINVHYSISKIAASGDYKPRLADDRIGYFLTVQKDFSKKGDDLFVRYINRWKLQKADPAAKLSPPKKPIVFWLENTIPFKFRKPIREGIAEWNRAYEAAGFLDAIEVRQQPADADWDPEDINYNTFRWITSNAGFAMGPSRVNPYTGEILDADIIFDADFMTYWKEEFETLTPEKVAAMTGGAVDHPAGAARPLFAPDAKSCLLHYGFSRQFAFGASALMAKVDPKAQDAELEKMLMQGLKEVTMHEVGHTLGLRHNFKASKYLSMKELNDVKRTSEVGLTASVMDYNATNISPKGTPQGDYFSTTVGPYDIWAIEYGYKQFAGNEAEELKKIASRSGEPALQFATDEDARGIDPDPDVNRFDLGSDSLEYAALQAKLMQDLIPGLVERTTKDGDDYTKVRKAFNVILAQHGQSMFFVSRNIGGVSINRSHKGDKNAKPPLAPTPVEQQRKALEMLENQVFNDKPFSFPPELYNQLASSRWDHWGTGTRLRKDFPVHDVILMWQDRVLAQLFSSVTLTRLHDAELKAPPEADVLTVAELLERLTATVFSDVSVPKNKEFSNRKPAISSLRRNLQRNVLQLLGRLALGRTSAPEDAQTIAYAELIGLQSKMRKTLKTAGKLDSYTRAHLQESADRIQKVREARLSLTGP